MSAVLQEVLGIQRDDTSLVRLGNVSEDCVNHSHEHSVLVWMTGVLDDRDDVGALLGDVDEIATGTMREFYGVDETLWTHDVTDVRDCCA